jgi:dTDP-4-dehydrorhamnose reductase
MPHHKVIVTGSNGLLGQKLVHLLRAKSNVELLATSTGVNRVSETESYTYKTLDITDAEAVQTLVDEFGPTAIINTAALTLVDLCEEEQERCDAINTQGLAHLATAALKHNAKLVQVSTDFVFDGAAGPYAEEAIPAPQSAYARSKYAAEQLLIGSDVDWAIARTIIVYGFAEQMTRSNVVLWAREWLRDGKEMNVVDDQFRSPTLAEDLALGCWAIVEQDEKGIFHLSGPEVMSIYHMVKRIASYYSFSTKALNAVKTGALNRVAPRPPHTGFVIDKAIEKLAYSPRTIEEGLAIIDKQAPL